MARCPSHDDRTASLSIAVGDNGSVLLNCHAGCATCDVLSAVGLKMSDLWPDQPKTKVLTGPRRIVDTYDYRDEAGVLLFQVVRYEPKTFRQRAPDGNGGWVHSLDGVRRVPYRLPELLAADGDAPIFVCEGEKDADRLAAIGLDSTTAPQGAAKWKEEYNVHLAGHDVVVLPDNDDPGRKHADQVALSLSDDSRVVKVVELPGLAEHGDLSDWIDAGGTVSKLLDLVETTPEHEPDEAEQPATRYRIHEHSALMSGDFTIEYLVNDVVPTGQYGLISGRFKSLKTTVAYDLAVSVATGTPFLGRFHVPTPRPVLFMSGETIAGPLQEIARRMQAAKGVDLTNIPLFWSTDLPNLLVEEDMAELRRFIEDRDVGLVVLDPTYLLMAEVGGDASNLFAMGRLLRPVGEIVADTGSSLLLVNHNKKSRAADLHRFDPPELSEIAMSGFAEWCRYHVLLGPREEWDPEVGQHWLWMRTGGMTHAGLWAVDVFEGKTADEGGRRWDVVVRSSSEDKELRREDKKREEHDRLQVDIRKVVEVLTVDLPDGGTWSRIRDLTGAGTPRTKRAIAEAVRHRFIKPDMIQAGPQKSLREGYRLYQEDAE